MLGTGTHPVLRCDGCTSHPEVHAALACIVAEQRCKVAPCQRDAERVAALLSSASLARRGTATVAVVYPFGARCGASRRRSERWDSAAKGLERMHWSSNPAGITLPAPLRQGVTSFASAGVASRGMVAVQVAYFL